MKTIFTKARIQCLILIIYALIFLEAPYLFAQDLLFWESADKNTNIKLGGELRLDFNYYNDSGTDADGKGKNAFNVDKAKLRVKGTLYKYFGFKLSGDFAETYAELLDAYVKYNYSPDLEIRIGQIYYPYGLERLLMPSEFYPFLERTTITKGITFKRDRGIGIESDLFNDRLHLETGIFNGTGANKPNDDDNFDIAARITVTPIRFDKVHVLLGASYATGQVVGTNDSDIKLKTETNSDNKYFDVDIPTNRKYDRERFSSGATFIVGPVAINGEVMMANYKFDNTVDVTGGYATASYMLTKERISTKKGSILYQDVINPFSIEKRQWGSWELALRYSWFKIDERFFEDNGLYSGWAAASRSKYADGGSALSAGVNWRLNSLLRIMFNWTYSKASNSLTGGNSDIFKKDNGNGTEIENAFLTRFELNF
ncbi:MAG: porin [Nitrospirota bacterium]